MKKYILNWQNPSTRDWHSVGTLSITDKGFIFSYTQGAKTQGFTPLDSMADLETTYLSDNLFPVFENRILSPNRPEYNQYADWTDLNDTTKFGALTLMARLGGLRATDNLQVQEVPTETTDGKYTTLFFAHGLRHRPPEVQELVNKLNKNDQLYPMLDVQNPYDPTAIALRTEDPATLIGYCPRFLTHDICRLIDNDRDSLKITVRKINYEAPPQYRLLCEVSARWPDKWLPCMGHEQIPLTSNENRH